MTKVSFDATVERWLQEEDHFLDEVRELARREAIDFAGSSGFTIAMRAEAGKLVLDDFREPGDMGLCTKLVVEHPVFGRVLRGLLNVHNLSRDNRHWLSDSAEAFVTVFFKVLGQFLDE